MSNINLMRSVEKFDTRSTISCHMVESFVSCFKFLTRSAENFVGRITSLSLTFEVFVSWIQVLFHSTVFSRRESLLCLTVSKKLLGAPQFCPSYEKNDSRVTFLSEKDKIFEIFFKKKSHNVKFFEEWIINLYHVWKNLWGELQFCPTFPKVCGKNQKFVSQSQKTRGVRYNFVTHCSKKLWQ